MTGLSLCRVTTAVAAIEAPSRATTKVTRMAVRIFEPRKFSKKALCLLYTLAVLERGRAPKRAEARIEREEAVHDVACNQAQPADERGHQQQASFERSRENVVSALGYHLGGASGVHIMARRASPRSRLTGLNTSHSCGSTCTSIRG